MNLGAFKIRKFHGSLFWYSVDARSIKRQESEISKHAIVFKMQRSIFLRKSEKGPRNYTTVKEEKKNRFS